MTDKELDNYMKAVEPNFTSHIENGTIEMSNEYYNLLEEKMARLINETQELKKQLEEANKKLYLCTPEIPQNVHGKYVSYVDLVNEMYELKKQLEEYKATNKVLSHELTKDIKQDYLTTCCGIPIGDIPKLIDQQKEFIKYLEDEIKLYENDIQTFSKNYNVYFSLINDLKVGKARTKDILQKYKEIIGGNKDE